MDPSGVKAWGHYPGGQSGNPGSLYYDNMVESWTNGHYFELLLWIEQSLRIQELFFTDVNIKLMTSFKVLLKIGFTAMLAFLLQTTFPWWSVVVASFLISLIISTKGPSSFYRDSWELQFCGLLLR